MEMPVDCARCGHVVELNDTYDSSVEGPSGSRVECSDCHKSVLSDEGDDL